MTYLGLDFGGKFGVAVCKVTSSGVTWETKTWDMDEAAKHGKTIDQKWAFKIGFLRGVLNDIYGEYSPVAVAYERPCGRYNSVQAGYQWLSYIRLWSMDWGVEMYMITPTDLKKRYAGKGNVGKSPMQTWATNETGIDLMDKDSEHEADAVCLADYARAMHEQKG